MWWPCLFKQRIFTKLGRANQFCVSHRRPAGPLNASTYTTPTTDHECSNNILLF
jgi:hypothetical protein